MVYLLPKTGARDSCAILRENVEIVRGGASERRVAGSFHIEQHDNALISVEHTEGDFDGVQNLEGVRTCLGPGWSETHMMAHAAAYGDVWAFSRPDYPRVMYVQRRTENYRQLQTSLIVERND